MDILPVLNAATSESLKQPRCASSVLSKNRDGSYVLYTCWSEDKLSITGVQLQCGTNELSMSLSDIDKREALRASESTVLMGALHRWDASNAVLAAAVDGVNAGILKVRLLRELKPASEWFRPCVYSEGVMKDNSQ